MTNRKFATTEHARDGELNAPNAFDSTIGKRVPLKVDGVKRGTASLVAAKVSADGRSAELTYELDSPEIEQLITDNSPRFSIGGPESGAPDGDSRA